MTAGAALRPDGLLWYPALPNPIPVPAGLRDALAATVGLGTVLLVLALVVASGWLARRARQAQGSQRRQLAWIVAGGLIMSVTLAPLFLARYVVGVDDALGERIVFTAALGAVVFPLTVSIAVQREDLFGIRDLLGRSLVYVPLMALLAGLYSASVMLFQKLFVAFTGASSDAAVVLATLLVASSLAPARSLLESIVKRTTQASEAAGAERPAHGLTGAEDEDELDGRLARLEARLAHLERSPRSRRTWDRERSPAAHRRGASRSRERRSSSPVP